MESVQGLYLQGLEKKKMSKSQPDANFKPFALENKNLDHHSYGVY